MNPGGSNPYDTAGNMTSWNGANGYSYGPFNETWRVVTSNQEWVHVYTADDERLFSYEVGGGQLRRWALRGLDNRVLREYTFVQDAPSGVIERDNIYRGSGPLLAAATPAGDRHYHVDHLGTPRQITDATGAQVAFHTYYPYGEEATSPTQDTVRFKFTGHERDLADPTDTQDDLDHMHARMTNPKLGRFLSVDPAMESARKGSPQTWNRYAYVAGNPLKYTDPTGEAILALVWPVAEVALTGMDVWETAKTIGDADRSGAEKIVKVGLTILGAVTIGGGATKVDNVVEGAVKLGEEAASIGGKAVDAVAGALQLDRHHSIPKEILKQLPPDVASHPLVRGRAGAPNRWPIPRSLHREIHSGPRGGAYNEAFKGRLGQLGRSPTVEDVVRVRDELVREFGIEGYRP